VEPIITDGCNNNLYIINCLYINHSIIRRITFKGIYSMQVGKTIVADIAGGHKPKAREIGDHITIQNIWDLYRWYPGFRDMIGLEVDAIFSNGINEDEKIEPDRLIECKEGLRWAIMAGYSTVIVDGRSDNPRCEAWHPYIDGIGFNFTKFSPKGHPLEITVYMKANETAGGNIQYIIPHYPCETDADGEYLDDQPIPGGYGFFHLRTQGNLKGCQGLPQYLHLMDSFKIQWDIIKAYGPYAEKQGMAFPTVFLKENSKTNRSMVKSQFATQPTTNRLLIMGDEDAIEWVSPQAGAYDPFPMLQWINTVLARASQMNKLMLEGDPAGYLSASETAISNWEAKNKEKQAYWRTQLIGVWIALGGSDETNFKDPAKPAFISLMEGLLAMRQAMDGLIEPEDIVNLMNEYLESNDQKRDLHAMSKEEMMANNNAGQPQNNNGNEAPQE